MSIDIADWLRGLGLEQYAQLFRDNDIDGEILGGMNAEDLKELGISSFGHRRRLLNAITALGGAPATRDVAQSAMSVTSAPVSHPIIDAERRQLTVMFCDVVGSTALSTRYDPEDLRELIGGYHRAVAETVGRCDGFVAKYMGDGVLIYFGYPQAHEDDAERAVYAALAVIEAVGRLSAREELRVRLGIATGLAVVGDLIGEGAAQERGVVGETPNLAARLQALATPNTLVIAEATRRQIGELFDLEDLGPQQLAGFAEPQRAWRVLAESAEVSRFDALRSGETPLVGRDEEIELLRRRWVQAKSGEGRVVLISGEPGIGKSRLTVALSAHIESEPHARLRYFCSPHHQDSALYPFIAQLERAAGFTRDDTVDAKLGKLRALLAPGMRDDDDIALLSELLSLPSSAADLNLSERRKREKLLEALLNQLEAEARHQPVLMVFEDAQWIDPTSRELLDLSVDRVRRLPVLLAITFRPEFQPPWGGRSYVMNLTLNRLGERDGETLVHKLAGDAALTAEIVGEIVERTDGVPLFVEELTKAVLESAGQRDRVTAVLGAASHAAQSVPATLHASLMARLDRLGLAPKETAQIGAVLGREFSYELIEPVAQRPESELQAALRQLTDAGLLFCRGTAPHASYLFKHALVQDAAYGTLLRARRREMHARVAGVLEQRFPDFVETRPEILAHHYGEAAMADKAIAYWHLAGKSSVAKSAVTEAIAQLRRGLGLLDGLPETRERQQLELDIHVTLATALMAGKGYANPEVVAALERANRLVTETMSVGTPLHFTVLYGLWISTFSSGSTAAALEHATNFLSSAQSQPSFGPLLVGHRVLAFSLMLSGDYRAALAHAETAASLYRPDEYRDSAIRYGTDIGVSAFGTWSLALWHRGYPDRSARATDRALALSRQLGHAHTLAHALNIAGVAAVFARDVATVYACGNEQVALASEHGFAQWAAWGRSLHGWADAQKGEATTGIARIRDGLAAAQATGSRLNRPFFLALLAEALALAGKIEEGLAALDDALAQAAVSGERGWDAEIHRLRGELTGRLPYPDPAKAEDSFHTALAIAREQGTRGYELRAATSLARLWREQGRRAEARDLLAPLYSSFTEGLDTADLKEAKALLDELA